MSDTDTVNVVLDLQPMSMSDTMVKVEVSVKQQETCGVCGAVGDTTTPVTEVEDVVRRFAARAASLPLCVSCEELLVALAAAEREYRRLRAILAASLTRSDLSSCIKSEVQDHHNGSDSDDEPLARTKQKHVTKRSKKVNTSKQKSKCKEEDERWECEECGIGGNEGGPMAAAAHKITCHDLADCPPMKTEPNDSMDDSQDISCFEKIFKSEEDMFDDDDSNYFPDEICKQDSKNSKRKKAVPHTKEKKQPKKVYPCTECNAKYTTEARLSRHKDNKHDGSKPPYICEICGAHYKHKRACDIHVALHKGISDWKCEECNKLFPSKGALARHNNIHTGKLNYQCDLCGKSFIHTSSFKMHKLSHSGVKPHACDVCGLALLTRSHLRRHQRVHSGEKRHACAHCGKRFSERYNLLAHAKSHEQVEAGSSARDATAEPRRMFRCHYCSERFERRYMLERHMGAAHNRALERPPPTPRNTMSKLLKQQAAKLPPAVSTAETKQERSPEEKLVRGATQIQPSNWTGFAARPPYIIDE